MRAEQLSTSFASFTAAYGRVTIAELKTGRTRDGFRICTIILENKYDI